ncbi:MAG: hypothetical protein ABW187_02305 [Dokdonella sp.]
MRSNDFVLRSSFLRAFGPPAVLAFLGASLSTALAAAPQYHLTALVIPGMQGIYVNDINDAGEMVGYYVDENFANHAFLWDADGPHDLAVPTASSGDPMDSAAVAINNVGQIAGYAQDIGVSAPGMLWNRADTTQYTLLDAGAEVGLTPRDISDNGTVVGLKANLQTGEAFHGFVWTAETGDVDYGTTDNTDGTINASWMVVNDAGQLAGIWNYQFSPAHATVGTVGTPTMLPMGAATDAVESSVLAMNADGVRVGYMDVNGSGDSVPVIFAADGSASAIPGAALDLPAGQALGINNAGVIVGRADDFDSLTFKAFVSIDGASYDLYDHVDDTGGYDYFLTARAVNASGTIVGLARYGDLQVGSYVLTPIADDGIFSDGFDA